MRTRGRSSEPCWGHVPVLLTPVLAALQPQLGEVALDCTVGRGGHAAAFAERVGSEGTVVGVDLDEGNLAASAARVEALGTAHFVGVHGSFATAPARLVEAGLVADVVLADLGFSSIHVDDAGRGFSFSADGPLDMRYDCSRGRTAAELLRELPERELAEMFIRLGEDPLAAKIARKIAHARRAEPIETTRQLAGLVEAVYGLRARHARLHPATRTFMALRIAVNDELNALASLLAQIGDAAERVASEPARDGTRNDRNDRNDRNEWLRAGSRVAIIAFHSLEDRLVKHAFTDLARRGLVTRLTRRPVVADDAELAANPRSRPAKLRAIVLGGGPPGREARYEVGRLHGAEDDHEDDQE